MDGLTCRLTSKDFSILEVMLERRAASGDRIVPLLERKLAAASVVLVDSIEADVATLNSRVTFRIDGGPAETRTLVQDEVRGLADAGLPITTMRGLALLGLREGQSVEIDAASGEGRTVLLEKVVYQPEAARRQFAPQSSSPTPPQSPPQAASPEASGQPRRPALRLVHSAPADVTPLGESSKIRQRGPYDDDPGPSAA